MSLRKKSSTMFFVLFLLGVGYVSFIFFNGKCLYIKKEISFEVNDEGFISKTLSIKRCTQVTFINTGKEMHWPASDLHPTHSIYPEFDPLEPLEPGESWSFVFDKIGNWKCHDHLTPLQRCMISVSK